MAEDSFKFQNVVPHLLSELHTNSKDTLELLEKWGMSGRMKSHTFFFNKHFQPYQKQAFAQEFFKDDVVNNTLQVLTPLDQWIPLQNTSIDAVTVEEVSTTMLSMDFFDRLYTSGVVRKSGHIVKCFDEMIDDFLVSDELKKLLLDKDSQHYHIYSTQDREEFLFKIFQHLVLGGPVNQYEDVIKPYLDTAKLIYKELVSVVKDPDTNQLTIASTTLKVQAQIGNATVFPTATDHTQSFCYLVIDNIKRHVKVWYHIWS